MKKPSTPLWRIFSAATPVSSRYFASSAAMARRALPEVRRSSSSAIVVALGDEAALAAFGRRRGDERADVEIGQRAVAAERWQQPVQQRGALLAPLQMLHHPPRLGQTVAQLAEIARGPAPRHHPAQRPADVGQRAQHRPQILAQQRIVQQPLHQFEPFGDRLNARKRRGQILRQLPRAGAGDAAVDGVDQAALAGALATGENFQAGPRRLVHRQMRRAAARDRRQQQRQRAAPGVVEIGDQPPGGCQHRAGEAAKAIERGDAVRRLQPGVAAVAGEVARRARDGIARFTHPALGRHHLARPQPRQRGAEQLGRAFLQLHPPGRNVASRQADQAAHLAHRRQHIRPAWFEQRLLGQRPRRDEADDIARHQRLRPAALFGLCRAFDLLGNRHAAARLDQPRKIALRRMRRHPAHRHPVAPAGQRNVEDLRGLFGIIEEQLEEIAHSVEQQAIRRLSLEREVLRHHRGGGGVHRRRFGTPRAIRKAKQASFPLSRRRDFG